MKLSVIFPTVIGYEHNLFSDSDHKKIIDLCYSIKSEKPDLKAPWLVEERGPYASINKDNIVERKNFSFFIDLITKKAQEYVYNYESNNEIFCDHGWVNIYSSENYQEPHYHAYSDISAVYFAKVPDGAGAIVFQRPDISIPKFNPLHVFETDHWVWPPEENMLLIFKSTLRHYVLHGKNNEDRISIAMNFSKK